MSCTRQFLSFHWEHHSWRKRVTLAENVPSQETSMWGRPVNREFVRCHKQDVCEVCGKTRRSEGCLCDTAHAEQCAIRLAWIDASKQATGS
jgi:hypothetical protein